MKIFNKYSVSLLVFAFTLGLTGIIFAAPTTVGLGTTTNFAVLGSTAITNTGATVINGDMGLSPDTAVSGFPPGVVNGTQHITDGVAAQAQVDLITAYNDAEGRTPVLVVPTELGGTTKLAGVYASEAGDFEITGTLTLDGQNDPTSVFIFLTDSTLITDGSSVVNLINDAQACNVFWKVGSSATLGTNSIFKGSIFALASITLTTGANVEGRVLARTGAVTLDANTITRPICTSGTTGDTGNDSLVNTGGMNMPWIPIILLLTGVSAITIILSVTQKKREL